MDHKIAMSIIWKITIITHLIIFEITIAYLLSFGARLLHIFIIWNQDYISIIIYHSDSTSLKQKIVAQTIILN